MGSASELALQLRREMREAEEATALERRRSEVLERATADGRIERDEAERVYDLALEESLEPGYALALVRSGLLVRELEPPERSEDSVQQDPPDWINPDEALGGTLERERRLRASLRRLRAMLHREHGAGAAIDAYLAEPDVEGYQGAR